METIMKKSTEIENLTKDLYSRIQGEPHSRKPLSKGFGKYNPLAFAR
jgi:hypothetical protein